MYAVLQFPNLYCLNNWPKSHYIWKICEFNNLYWAIAITFWSLDPDNIFRSKKRYLDPKISFLSNPSLCSSSSCSVALRLWCCTGWPGQGSGILNWHLLSFGERHLQASCPFSTPLVFFASLEHLWPFWTSLTNMIYPVFILNKPQDLSKLHEKNVLRKVKAARL